MERSERQKLLDHIIYPADLKKLNVDQLSEVCDELRQFIIDECSSNPGHLGASLGVVELTVALHYVYDTPHDALIWDVGHQAYCHKILTGRKKDFHTNRKYGGISGFPRMAESEYDAFGTGHSSTSISASGRAIWSIQSTNRVEVCCSIFEARFAACPLPAKNWNTALCRKASA